MTLTKTAPFRIAPLLCLLLGSGAPLLVQLPSPAAPVPQPQTATNPNDRIQQLIDRQNYDQAWQEIRRLAEAADREYSSSWFPMPAIVSGSAVLRDWSLKLGEAQVKTGHYQAAFQFAKDSKYGDVNLAIAKSLYRAGQVPLSDRLFSQLIANARKGSPIERNDSLSVLSYELFQLGAVEASDRLLEDMLRTVSSNGTFNEKWMIFNQAGVNTDNIDRTVKIADRLGLSQDQSVILRITELAIRKENVAVAERNLKQLKPLSSDVMANLYMDLASLYFSQKQTPQGLVSLTEASIYSQMILSDPQGRDAYLERVALLYQSQKQSQKAKSIASKIRDNARRQSLLTRLKSL
jgi:hypothetical protein